MATTVQPASTSTGQPARSILPTTMSKVQLSFTATDLLNPSLFGSIDSMLVVSQSELPTPGSHFTTIFSSDVILNTTSPQWRRPLITYFYPQQPALLRLQIYAVKTPNLLNLSEHSLIGQFDFNLSTLLSHPSRSLTGKLLKPVQTLCKHGSVKIYSTILQQNLPEALPQIFHQPITSHHTRLQSRGFDLTSTPQQIEKHFAGLKTNPNISSAPAPSPHPEMSLDNVESLNNSNLSVSPSQLENLSQPHIPLIPTVLFDVDRPSITPPSARNILRFSISNQPSVSQFGTFSAPPQSPLGSQSAQLAPFTTSNSLSGKPFELPKAAPQTAAHTSIETSFLSNHAAGTPTFLSGNLEHSTSSLNELAPPALETAPSNASIATNLTTQIPFPVKSRPHRNSITQSAYFPHADSRPYPKKVLCKIDLKIAKKNKNLFFQILTIDSQTIVYQSPIISYSLSPSFPAFQLDVEQLIKPNYGVYYERYQKDHQPVAADSLPPVSGPTVRRVHRRTLSQTIIETFRRPSVSSQASQNIDDAVLNAHIGLPPTPPPPQDNENFMIRIVKFKGRNLDQPHTHSRVILPISTLFDPLNVPVQSAHYKPTPEQLVATPVQLQQQTSAQTTPSTPHHHRTASNHSIATSHLSAITNSTTNSGIHITPQAPPANVTPGYPHGQGISLPLFNKGRSRTKGELLISFVDPSYSFDLIDFLATQSLNLTYSVGIDFNPSKKGYDHIDSSHYCKKALAPRVFPSTAAPHGTPSRTGTGDLEHSRRNSNYSQDKDNLFANKESMSAHRGGGVGVGGGGDGDGEGPAELTVDQMDWCQNSFITAINDIVRPLIQLTGGDVQTVPITSYGFAGRYDNGEEVDEPITSAFPLSLFDDTPTAIGVGQLLEQYKEARLSLEKPQLYHCFSSFINTLTTDLHRMQTPLQSFQNYNPHLLYNSLLPPLSLQVQQLQQNQQQPRRSSVASNLSNHLTSPALSNRPILATPQQRHPSTLTNNNNNNNNNNNPSSLTTPQQRRPSALTNNNQLTQAEIDQLNSPDFRPQAVPPSFHVSFVLTDQPNSFANAKSILNVLNQHPKLPFCIIVICLKSFTIQSFNNTFDYLNKTISPYPLWNIENAASMKNEVVHTGTGVDLHHYTINTSKLPHETISPLQFLTPNLTVIKLRYYQNHLVEILESINNHAMTFLTSNLLYPCNFSYTQPISGNAFPFPNTPFAQLGNEQLLVSAQRQAQFAIGTSGEYIEPITPSDSSLSALETQLPE